MGTWICLRASFLEARVIIRVISRGGAGERSVSRLLERVGCRYLFCKAFVGGKSLVGLL